MSTTTKKSSVLLFTSTIVILVLVLSLSSIVTVKANPFKLAAECTRFQTKGGECGSDNPSICIPGYSCIDGKCQIARYFIGRSCKSTADCLSIPTMANAYCFERRCQFLGRYEGDFCVDDTQCRTRRCFKNKCAAVAVGEPCNDNGVDVCTMGAACLDNKCEKLNALDEVCLLSETTKTVKSLDCASPNLCDKTVNKCVKPATKIGESCDDKIDGHCAPSKSRYCKKITADKYECAETRKIGEECDTLNDVRCEHGLSCDPSQQVCVVPFEICTSKADCSKQECYCTNKGGYCGRLEEINCKREYLLFDNCLKEQCNPYVKPDPSKNKSFLVADSGSCVRTKCNLPMRAYYDCIGADLSERSLSLPSIQGYSSDSSSIKSVQIMTLLIALVAYILV